MANDLNQCNFIGRLGNDPEIKYLASGEAVANISLAVGWKSKDKEGAEWVRIVAFKKLAEIIGEYLRKGSKVYISGSMRTRKWTDSSGNDRYSTEIVANNMQMLDNRPADSQAPAARQQPAHTSTRSDPPPSNNAAANFDDFDDDIPF